MKKQPRHSPPPALSKTCLLGLWLSAASMSALALWQWLELLKVRRGGSALCAVDETLNCEVVWDTAFAAWVQTQLGLPVAAWGLIWGVGALGWAATLSFLKTPAWLGLSTWSVRLWALAGVLACALFAYVSWQAGAVCLSCLATFALVALYAFFAFSLLPLDSPLPKQSLLYAALLCLAVAALPAALLQPLGEKTARPTSLAHAAPPSSLKAFLAALSPQERAELEKIRKAFLAAPPSPLSPPTPGRWPLEAPVVIQEFTDIKCGHCQTAEALLSQLLQKMPPGSLAVEPRYYPLDAECNPHIRPPASASGVRCAAALAQICLEGAADFAQLRSQLFRAASRLASREEVLSLASQGKTPRAQLEACMASPDALSRLHADIALAQKHGIGGTPFFLLNGKPAPFSPSFWTAMVLAQANPQHPEFLSSETHPPSSY